MPLILAEPPKTATRPVPPPPKGITRNFQSQPAAPQTTIPKPPPNSGAQTSPLGTPDPPKSGGKQVQKPLPPDWKVLVPDGTGTERTDGPKQSNDAMPRPPETKPKPGLTIDVLCKKLGIPEEQCVAENADEALKSAGRHNWPPIIPLKEADGYYFVVGSAQPSPDFAIKLRQAIVPEIVGYAKEFQTDVIEVVGHTDDQPIQGMVSNLDTLSFDVLLRGEPAAKLRASDNAGLGFARAVAIVQILNSDERLKKFIILPSSSAQVVDTFGKLANGSSSGDVKQRRRIEIRLRQSEEPSPR